MKSGLGNYTVRTWASGDEKLPHAVVVGWGDSQDLRTGWTIYHSVITSWLIDHGIRNEHKLGLLWYLEKLEDVTLFMLRWA